MSIFQYIGGILVGTSTIAYLFLIERFATRMVLVFTFLVWLAFLFLVYLFVHKAHPRKYELLFYTILTGLSLFGLTSVVELPLLRVLLFLLTGLITGLIYGWGITGYGGTFLAGKPFRRFLMMVLMFDLFSLSTTAFAVGMLGVLLPGKNIFFLIALALGIVASLITLLVWRLYYEASWQTFFLWAGLIVLIVTELAWVIHLLPLGYVVSGFFLTWCLYIVQLLIRFHFTEKGIVWREQRTFLVCSVGLILMLLLFYVRWV